MVGLRANDYIKAVQTDRGTVLITDQDQFVALVKEQKGKSITLEISRMEKFYASLSPYVPMIKSRWRWGIRCWTYIGNFATISMV
jgi:hypothetical protein